MRRGTGRQTDAQTHRNTQALTQTVVTNPHFASATPRAKCNYTVDMLLFHTHHFTFGTFKPTLALQRHKAYLAQNTETKINRFYYYHYGILLLILI